MQTQNLRAIKNNLNIALDIAKQSHDPSKKVGCCVTDIDYNYIEGQCNKFPIWFNQYNMTTINKEFKALVVEHAEIRTLQKMFEWDISHLPLYMFVTCYPCKWCCLSIINSIYDIKKIYYIKENLSDTFKKRYCLDESEKLLKENGIELIGIDMNEME